MKFCDPTKMQLTKEDNPVECRCQNMVLLSRSKTTLCTCAGVYTPRDGLIVPFKVQARCLGHTTQLA